MNWETRVTKILGIKYPIIQGGLAYLAYAELAASVSNAGGLGQITAMSLESPEKLREEIKKLGNLQINLLVSTSRLVSMADLFLILWMWL